MAEDEEDYVFYGTPIEREEETSSRKRKAIAEAGQLRSLPPWKQEVRDEEGRKRFHGAFTGGFSAGYYNTAGSKEGWTPQTFTSSRKSRAEVTKQNIYNFLDDEDIQDMGGHALETSLQFDTFGFTTAELARKQAEKEQEKRPSAIPGPVPDEIILPAANSIGVKLLLKMGWRHGHAIRETHADSSCVSHREARKAFLAFSGNEGGSKFSQVESTGPDVEDFTERCNDGFYSSQSTSVFVLHPKKDLHGLGYDPFKHAPEFRDRKRFHESTNKDQGSKGVASMKRNVLASNSGKYAPGFGIGALEELDVEDEDIYASGFDYVETEVEEVETTNTVRESKHRPESRKQGALSGFKVASSSDYNLERFKPPFIPPDFEPLHKFPFPLETAIKYDESPPPEVPPPEENSLRLLIDGFATLVARCGKLFEDLSKEKNKSNPLFSFLSGGNGHNYYARKLWEEKQRNVALQTQVDMKAISSAQKMTADGRGRILGERPLEKSSSNSTSSAAFKEVFHFQSNLSDTFTKPASLAGFAEYAKPFKTDPPKQERFEQFLKDKYEGGLRSTYSGGSTIMSETDRARERLDFEAVAEAIRKGEWNPENNLPSISQHVDFQESGEEKQRVSQGERKTENKIYPKRETFEWRPSPILCKRFDIIDPFIGKAPPIPRARSRMDTLIFTADSVINIKSEVTDKPNKDSLTISESGSQRPNQLTARESDIELNTTTVQRPVDLYKAIFSDDSDDDGDNATANQVEDSEKTEGVNTTLNRLIAGDFLESLGKELGLEVPMDTPRPLNKTNNLNSSMENVGSGDIRISLQNDKSTSVLETSNKTLEDMDVVTCKSRSPNNSRENAFPDKACLLNIEAASIDRDGPNHRNFTHSWNGVADGRFSNHEEGKVQAEKMEHQSRKNRSQSRHHRRRSSTSDTDSSSHHEYSYRSKSKAEKRTSSEGKIRKHSSHHNHKRNRSPVTSHDSDKDILDDGRRRRRSREREKHSGHSKSHGRRKYH